MEDNAAGAIAAVHFDVLRPCLAPDGDSGVGRRLGEAHEDERGDVAFLVHVRVEVARETAAREHLDRPNLILVIVVLWREHDGLLTEAQHE